jgi:hypothetical protein
MPWSEALSNIDDHRSKPRKSEFKSPLAHTILDMNVLVAALKLLVTRARRGLVVTDWSRIDGRTGRYEPAANSIRRGSARRSRG